MDGSQLQPESNSNINDPARRGTQPLRSGLSARFWSGRSGDGSVDDGGNVQTDAIAGSDARDGYLGRVSVRCSRYLVLS